MDTCKVTNRIFSLLVAVVHCGIDANLPELYTSMKFDKILFGFPRVKPNLSWSLEAFFEEKYDDIFAFKSVSWITPFITY